MRNLLALLLLAPCALLAQVPDYVPTDGLVAYWPLDGNATNASGTDYDGVISGATPTSDRHGEENSAFAFDGVDDRITIPNDFNFTALTVSTWFYRSSQASSYQAIVDRSLANNIGWWIEESQVANEHLFFTGGVASGNYFTTTASLPEFGEWTHVCATYEAGHQQLYLNGVLTSTDDNALPLQFPDADLYIGSRTSTAWFHGAIDDVAIWNRVITQEEVSQLYGASIAPALPEYVPTDNLIAWYSLDSTYTDQSGNEFDLCAASGLFVTDRFGNEGGAYLSEYGAPLLTACDPSGTWPDAVSYSLWFNATDLNPDSYPSNWFAPISMNGWSGDALGFLFTAYSNPLYNCDSVAVRIRPHWPNSQTALTQCTEIVENEWYHICITGSPDHCSIYLNSILIDEFELENVSQFSAVPFQWTIGASSLSHTYQFKGAIDEVGIWGSELTSSEVVALYLQGMPIASCTDSLACNYNAVAILDDGSCDYSCCPGPGCCADGTVWDIELEQCVGLSNPIDTVFLPIPSCGPGTVWDPINEMCIVAIPADLNFDGCVTVGDLLELLAVHGTCPPYPEWPDFPGDTSTTGWSCGDPLPYQGYDYATVQIGDQCWFAENLQSLSYSDGSLIQTGLDDSNWASTNEGAVTTYGTGSSPCFSGSPDFEACDDTQSLSTYGRLYNWHSVLDSRNICPINWHVSSDEDWFSLEEFLGLNGFSGAEGLSLKSESGWANGGNGPDQFGFTALPGGVRNGGGIFDSVGIAGAWWTSTPIQDGGWRRDLYWSSNNLIRLGYPDGVSPQGGFSVRCVKD